jgi:outer membrane lipoprotein-sorting protein
MHIDKNTYHIVDIKLVFKDGTRQIVELSNYKTNTTVADSEFIFDQNKYKGVVINDMRF